MGKNRTQIYFIANGLNVFCALVKIMGFMRINKNLSQLTDTIALMASDLFQFAMVPTTLRLYEYIYIYTIYIYAYIYTYIYTYIYMYIYAYIYIYI